MTIAATTSLEEAASRTWDVVIVGAGPAGAMSAYELSRRGLAVLLVDRASFPRWKVCGCCLNARALAALAEAGLGALTVRCGAVSLDSFQVAVAGRVARLAIGGAVSLSRQTLDAALVTAAIGAGAAFLPRTQAVLSSESRVRSEEHSMTPASGTPNSELRTPNSGVRVVELRQEQKASRMAARVVLLADGLGGKLVARAGISEVATAPGARIGVGMIAANAPAFYEPGRIFMACGREGYLGLVRLEDGRLDLAAALDPGWVRAHGGPGPAAAEMLAEVGWPAVPDMAEHGWRGTPALTRRARRVAGERLFLVGDAAGYIEPFTGEGMAWALSAARALAPLAARAAERWHPRWAGEWGALYRRLLGTRHLVCRTVAAVLRSPGLTRTMIHLLSVAPGLAVPVLHGLGFHDSRKQGIGNRE